jgi:uncharacterized protein (DUF2249 family)
VTDKIRELDLRAMPVMERNPSIFDAWEKLPHGGTLKIINDHDPKPLRYQFESEYGGEHSWEYVEEGPEKWIVDVTKPERPDATLEELTRGVEDALSEVRPHLKADGGDVELVDIDYGEKTVRVRLTGACKGCPSAELTLKGGVERTIKKYAPEIRSVESIREG